MSREALLYDQVIKNNPEIRALMGWDNEAEGARGEHMGR